jgi:hypothetical protein
MVKTNLSGCHDWIHRRCWNKLVKFWWENSELYPWWYLNKNQVQRLWAASHIGYLAITVIANMQYLKHNWIHLSHEVFVIIGYEYFIIFVSVPGKNLCQDNHPALNGLSYTQAMAACKLCPPPDYCPTNNMITMLNVYFHWIMYRLIRCLIFYGYCL